MVEPLIYTKNGNVPVNSLRYEKHWNLSADLIQFVEEWWDGEELVRNNVHLYAVNGLPAIGGAQAQM